MPMLLLAGLLGAQEYRIDVSGRVDWKAGKFSAEAHLDLARYGFSLPGGRIQAENIISDEYPPLLRPFLLPLRVDSASTLEDLVRLGKLSLADLDRLSMEAEKTPPSLSADMKGMKGRFVMDIAGIAGLLNRRASAVPPVPLLPPPAADYTGVIIIADKELSVYGRESTALLEPCLFPAIYDTDMNMVHDRTMVKYIEMKEILQPGPSGLSPELEAFLGKRPLRILARACFGKAPTDLVIDRDDALLILATANNRRLLADGRIAVVLSPASL